MSGPSNAPSREAGGETSPFPLDLDLAPVSRWPTRLAPGTESAVLSRPLPSGSDPDPVGRGISRRVSIVVLTLDNLVFTRLCLESVLANTDHPDYELVVVDNGSGDATLGYLRSMAERNARIRLVLNGTNEGFARGNNRGLEAATGELFVLLNNDTVAPPGWLSPLIARLQDPGIGLVGAVTNRCGNEAQIEVPYRTYGGLVDFARENSRKHAEGCFDIRTAVMFCVATRRDVVERVGPLDERYGIGLFEDDDYAMSVRAAGLRVVCAEDAFVHHFGQASIGSPELTASYGDLFRVNRARFEEKWGVRWESPTGRRSAEYRALIDRVREAVDPLVPPDALLLVVSRGDNEFLRLGGRRAWHFPRADDGGYAGHYPADSAEAVAHLEALRSEGAEYLLFPRTSSWWLDHYPGLESHLGRTCLRRTDVADLFTLYRLSPVGTAEADGNHV